MSEMSRLVQQIQEDVGEGPEAGPKTRAAFVQLLEERMAARGVQICPACRGLSAKCATCHGAGEVKLGTQPVKVPNQGRAILCPVCGGRKTKCPACGGTGQVYLTEK